jgi:hypothetical protein
VPTVVPTVVPDLVPPAVRAAAPPVPATIVARVVVAPLPTPPAAAKAPAAPNASSSPNAPTTPSTPNAPNTSSAPSVAPAAIAPGAGSLKLGGLLQAIFTSGTPSARSTFRLRRAELKLSGELGKRVGWTVMFDAAKSLGTSPTYVTVDGQKVIAQESVNPASQMLQDASVTVRLSRAFVAEVGQMRVPLGLAGTLSAAKLEFVERPMYAADKARGGTLGDARDIGAAVRGTVARRVDVVAGVFNGSGESQNAADRNGEKAVAARVVVRDLGVTGLQVGASGVYGGPPTGDFARRDRVGGEVQYVRRALTLRSEYVTGVDGRVRRAGYYGHAGYRVRRGVELVGRADVFDPDVAREGAAATARARDLLGGVNVALAGANAALQLDVGRRSYAGAVTPTARQLLVNFQTAW